jgi:hypothetical protein
MYRQSAVCEADPGSPSLGESVTELGAGENAVYLHNLKCAILGVGREILEIWGVHILLYL